MRRRVLLVDMFAEIGGAQQSLLDLARNLPALAPYDYRVVVPAPGELSRRLLAAGIQVDYLNSLSWRWWREGATELQARLLSLSTFLAASPWITRSVVRWMRYLRACKPDLVHVNLNRLIDPLIAARLLKLPTVVHFRDIPSWVRGSFLLGPGAYSRVMSLADACIANSWATASELSLRAHTPVTAIHNSVDLSAFDVVPKPSDGRGTCIAAMGMIIPRKNYAAFVALADRLMSANREVNFLVIGGAEDDHGRAVRASAQHLVDTGRFTFLGHLDDIPGALSGVDILVHTARKEAFGRVLVEAMAAGIPVVAYADGGVPEIVVHGETGFLVPLDDEVALTAKVERLIADPALRARMGARGRERAMNTFSIASHCAAVAKVYDEVLARR